VKPDNLRSEESPRRVRRAQFYNPPKPLDYKGHPMKNITEFSIVPALPEKLRVLREIAGNLYWAWDHDLIELFRRMDPNLWEATRHNPSLILDTIDQTTLDKLAVDDGFLDHLNSARLKLNEYLADTRTWFQKAHGDQDYKMTVAYFSAEFGISECLPIYSGGLGVLAGDHVKSASDLGAPLVGVGLMYQHGYFRQYLNIDGYQQESYYDNDPYKLPVAPVLDAQGKQIVVCVPFPGRNVCARIWKAQVGRVPLYLLDTNVPANSPSDRAITYQLYGGDKEMRIQQEILMGVGGLIALDAIGIDPDVCHMNEGHAAFLGIERIRRLTTREKLSFDEALAAVRPGTIFTTHTPVPAGIDTFDPAMVDYYFSPLYGQLGLDKRRLLALGRRNPDNDLEPFNMVYLAFRLSGYYNGVSRLHGAVSRSMWQNVWSGVPLEDVPITYVTNGVHIHSWLSRDFASLYDRYLGHRWRENPTDKAVWDRVDQIPAEEIWRTHERRRERLVAFARKRLKRQLSERGASAQEISMADEVLEPGVLTIGFARRFATYKRATLLLKDVERLKRIMNNKDRPVQFIFAGKAHPRDEEGKAFIRQIVHFSNDPEVRRRIVFLENYDLVVSRYMVQGVDVWLNNPRRPMEASGTSGMKAVYNGALNLSTLDGWWDEAYELERDSGWAIGKGEEYTDLTLQDEIESNALYNLLENEVVPQFYQRSENGQPRRWIDKMRASISKLGPVFNTNRMVQEYLERFYLPAAESTVALSADNYARAKEMAAWTGRVREAWGGVRIEKAEAEVDREYLVGSELKVRAEVRLGSLTPDDISVEVYYGPLNQRREITGSKTVVMVLKGTSGDNVHRFEGVVRCSHSGRHGFTLRVLPRHVDMVHPYELGLILWQ